MTNEKFTQPLMYRIVITFHEAADYPAAIYLTVVPGSAIGSRSNRAD